MTARMRGRAETQSQIDSKSSSHNTTFPVGEGRRTPKSKWRKSIHRRRDSKEGESCSEKLRDCVKELGVWVQQ